MPIKCFDDSRCSARDDNLWKQRIWWIDLVSRRSNGSSARCHWICLPKRFHTVRHCWRIYSAGECSEQGDGDVQTELIINSNTLDDEGESERKLCTIVQLIKLLHLHHWFQCIVEASSCCKICIWLKLIKRGESEHGWVLRFLLLKTFFSFIESHSRSSSCCIRDAIKKMREKSWVVGALQKKKMKRSSEDMENAV